MLIKTANVFLAISQYHAAHKVGPTRSVLQQHSGVAWRTAEDRIGQLLECNFLECDYDHRDKRIPASLRPYGVQWEMPLRAKFTDTRYYYTTRTGIDNNVLQDVYDAVYDHYQEYGYGISAREIVEYLDWKSTSRVHRTFEVLYDANMLTSAFFAGKRIYRSTIPVGVIVKYPEEHTHRVNEQYDLLVTSERQHHVK